MNRSGSDQTSSIRYPRRNSAVLRLLGRSVLRSLRWQVEGSLPELPRFVVIAAPHTSNWDFVLGLAAAYSVDVKAHWIGKHTIFKWPFRGFFQRLGGIPINRETTEGFVDSVVRTMSESEALVLGIAPEGTRSRVDRWRSGFYYIALGAGVPIVPCAFDYSHRRFRVYPPFTPGGDFESDLEQLLERYDGLDGKKKSLLP
jgi:1-acyl-sn-glycerol-3-phosphate acyltransferase